MNVLVIGSGGREHAVVKSLKKSSKVKKLYCAPGNGGISKDCECVALDIKDNSAVVNFARKNNIDFVCVTPDDPLCAGMVDALESENIKAFGPNKAAAIIEGSKVFSKNLMKKYNIPTAEFEVFDDYEKAVEYINEKGAPLVVKAEGLALGKGVTVANTVDEALAAVEAIMKNKKFGSSGDRVVIEECLKGQEVSVLCFCDGKTIKPMVSAQDHKRVYDNDMGPNTGGMGTFSPSRIYTKEFEEVCMETIFKPTMEAMNKENRPFKGVLYFGLMITEKGPMVIEYNARFGDPETQVILPRLKTDLMEIFLAVYEQRLDKIDVEWEDCACVCVVLASKGYPEKYKTGYPIIGLCEFDNSENINIFHAGTKITGDSILTSGGRVLGVCAKADNLDNAIKEAYEAVGKIKFIDMHYRKDIGVK